MRFTGVRILLPTVLLLASTALDARSVRASVACLGGDFGSQVQGQGVTTSHPNVTGGHGLYTGSLRASIDNVTPVELYCVDIDRYLCYPTCYSQGPDVSSQQIVWILNNYYPSVPSEPASLPTTAERGAAVQLAVWHFSDGVDISSGGSPLAVFDAARAIIAAANTASVPATPSAVNLLSGSTTHTPGQQHCVTATVLDQNNVPMSGVSVAFAVSGANAASGGGTTDGSGQVTFCYTGTFTGDDDLTATVNYMIPVGLHWTHIDCQSLIMGTEASGTIVAHQTVSWQPSTAVEAVSWGGIKDVYRK